MAGPSVEARRSVTAPGVQGELPVIAPKEGRFDGANFEKTPQTNNHNESAIVSCDRDDFFVDDFNVATVDSANEYKVEIQVSSESPTTLWGNGRIILTYNKKDQVWTLKALIKPMFGKEQEWKFCDAKAALDVIKAGLRCFANEYDRGNAGTAHNLLASIEANSQKIIEGMAIYNNRIDCTRPLPSSREYENDYPSGGYGG